MNYRPDIDGLRALAVLPVVLFHAGVPGPSGGYLGVDVFFVISGFLITSIVGDEIARGRFSLLSFYERRARRILPALSAVVGATIAAGWVLLLPGELADLGRSATATALFWSNIHFARTLDYFGQAAEFAPLLHTWSLAVEEQFYLVFPPLLMLLAARWPRRVTVLAVAGLALASLAGAAAMLARTPEPVFYLIPYRAWELGAGALLALMPLRAPGGRVPCETAGAAGLLAILIPVILYDADTPFPGLAALPPVAGAALLIWVGSGGGKSLATRLLSTRPMVWIGLISYSLYLWHWPIMAYARITLDRAHLPPMAGLAAAAVSVGVAWLSWRLIERPFRARPPQGPGRGAIFGATAAALAAMIGAGAGLALSGGVPQRVPSGAATLAGAADDRNARREACFGRLPRDGLCAVGRDGEGKVDFLFWGDSHADAMMPGLDRAARHAGQRGLFAGQSACPPIGPLRRIPEDRACTRFNAGVMEFVRTRPDIPLIILAARWTLSVEGTRYREETGSPVRLDWSGPDALRPAQAGNAALFRAGLEYTVDALRKDGRRVVILGPVPEAGWNVPASLARKALLGWGPVRETSGGAFRARAGTTERILAQIAAARTGVAYLPLADLFCDARRCRTEDAEGRPLYADDDHITATTARRLLAPRLGGIWDGPGNPAGR